jgi:hypothetical protein
LGTLIWLGTMRICIGYICHYANANINGRVDF